MYVLERSDLEEGADWNEPQRVAEAIHLMKVKHAVITSVDRDDLKDGGSAIWYNTIKAVKNLNPETTLETLIPDFKGNKDQIKCVADAAPEVVSHNIETTERLTRHNAGPWSNPGRSSANFKRFK